MELTDRQEVLDFARAELRSYLTQAGLPPKEQPELRLSVAEEPGNDSYTLCAAPDRICITGNNARSVLIGVYAFLKAIGFRFYAPGEAYTRIPELTNAAQLALPLRTERMSSFHRGMCIEGANAIENVLDYIDWLPKAGMNACFLQFFRPDVFFQRWYSHENNPSLPPEPLNEAQLAEFDARMTAACRKRGLMLHRAGHGWTSRVLGADGTGWQPMEEPADPAIRKRIALLNGQRKLFGGVPANTNLCYADPDVRQALVDEVVTYAQAHPEADYIHFWLADTYNNVCECEACRQTTPSDQYVEILNELDEALTARNLPARIVFLLYQELLYPPKTARFRHPERFTLMFAPISRTFEASYPEKIEAAPLPPWQRNRMTLPVGIRDNLACYAAWREVFSGDAFIYDYHLGRAHYGDLGYMTISHTLAKDLQRLGGLGFSGMIACQELRVLMPNPLPIYLMGQLLAHADMPPEEILQDFFSGLYGAEGERARAYFEAVSALCDTDYANANGPRFRPELARQYERIAERSNAFLQESEQMQTGPMKERLLAVAGQNALRAAALAALADGKTAEANRLFTAFCAMIRSDELRFQGELDVYRLIEVAEKYTGFTEIRETHERGRNCI